MEPSLGSLILLGLGRSAALFPFEHNLDQFKLIAQTQPQLSTYQAVTAYMKERGWVGLTDSAMANFGRRFVREGIRWPVIGMTHRHLTKNYPGLFPKDSIQSKFFTGFSVAAFDSAVMPIEQLMAFRIKEKERYRTFFRRHFSIEGCFSFSNFGVNLIRQSLLWSTFLMIDDLSKRKLREMDPKNLHPLLRQGITSLCVATALVAGGLPVDFVKVRKQMDRSLHSKAIWQVIPHLYRQYGVRGFYAGTLPVFIHSLFHATVGGLIVDKIFARP